MQTVGSGFNLGVNDATSRAPKLRIIGSRLKLKLRERIRGRLRRLRRPALKVFNKAVVVDAIQDEIVLERGIRVLRAL